MASAAVSTSATLSSVILARITITPIGYPTVRSCSGPPTPRADEFACVRDGHRCTAVSVDSADAIACELSRR